MPVWLAWVGLIDWRKKLRTALPYILAIGAVLALGWYIHSSGSKAGAAKVQTKWDKEKLENAKLREELRNAAASKEFIHQQVSQGIVDGLAEANQKYVGSLAALDAQYTQRLRNSEQRAAYYQHLSTAGTTEQNYLAGHAAQLDRSLEEGGRLVQELTTTLRQRDAQVVALGQQILTDRALVGEKDANSSASDK